MEGKVSNVPRVKQELRACVRACGSTPVSYEVSPSRSRIHSQESLPRPDGGKDHQRNNTAFSNTAGIEQAIPLTVDLRRDTELDPVGGKAKTFELWVTMPGLSPEPELLSDFKALRKTQICWTGEGESSALSQRVVLFSNVARSHIDPGYSTA